MGVVHASGRGAWTIALTGLLFLLTPASSWPQASGDAGAKDDPVPYEFHGTSGLHATIASKKELPKVTLKYQQRITVEPEISGYPEPVHVRASWHEEDAPAAVLLVGMPARAGDESSRLWAQYLFQAGMHVLVLDSVFHPDLYGRTRHGVSGNMEVEASVVARLVELAVEQSGKRERIRTVHLVGISYGGNVALTINHMSRRGELAFKPDRVLALSPTISMRTTAGLLDRWTEEDLEPLSIFDLMPLGTIKPLKSGEPTPFSDSLMRAGIAWALRGDLARTVKQNDKLYELGILKGFKAAGDPELKGLSSPKRWTFTQFWELMSFPYWKKRGGPDTLGGFWEMSGIDHLMAEKPGNVRVVLTEDDPLNSPEDLTELVELSEPDALVVLHAGGHLGYTRMEWVRGYIESWLVAQP